MQDTTIQPTPITQVTPLINKEELINLLKCSLCNGIFRTPTTINECMHSFCKGCIYKWFYQLVPVPIPIPIHDYCPICNIKLSGRPLETLVFDASLSLLIEILFPDFNEIDKVNAEMMYKAFRDNGEPLFDDTGNGNGNEGNDKDELILKICLCAYKAGDPKMILPEINKTLMVSRAMTIRNIKQYIDIQLNVGNEEDIVVSYNNQELTSHYDFDELIDLYKFNLDMTVLNYSRRVKPI